MSKAMEKVMKPFKGIAGGMAKNMDSEDLEMIMDSLIDSLLPPLSNEPKCKLCKLLKSAIEEQLRSSKATSVVLRILIPMCEEDPDKMLENLTEVESRLSELLDYYDNIVHGGE